MPTRPLAPHLALIATSFVLSSCGFADAAKPPCVLTDSVCTSCPSSASKLRLSGPFVPFGLCLTGTTPAKEAAYARDAGYDGLALQGLDLAEFRQFAALPEVASGSFRIVSALWWASVRDPVDSAWIDPILVEAARMGTAIWMVSEGPDKSSGSLAKAKSMYATAARLCKRRNVPLVIYPHQGCVVETAEEALAMRDTLARLGYPETRISIHLGHEIRLGNQSRLAAVVRKVAPWLALASVNGADSGASDWVRGIQPLDQGNFDPVPYLKALEEAGYAGPVVLHTYGLKNPFQSGYDNHLERSLKCWRQIVAPRNSTTSPRRDTTATIRGGAPRAGAVANQPPFSSAPPAYRVDGAVIAPVSKPTPAR